ncbi:Probable glutathione S-transferase (Auxin-induced protein PCNT103), partial [Durusdinium trenchii]
MDGLVFTPSAAPHATRAPCAVHAALHGTPSVRPGAGGAAFGAVSGLVAALVASQMAKPRSVRPRRVKHVCMAVPTEKPMRTTVFTKAALDGVSPGDCPFTHGVLMALKLKGVDYDVVACSPTTKPPWLLQEVGGQMPCVVHQGVAHVESGKILKWIDQTFPGPTLAVPSDFEELVSRAGLFAAIAEYTKNTDSSKDA